MSERRILLCVLCAFFLAAAVLPVPAAETFACDCCHRTVKEKPIQICEQTVDMTICSACYQDYLDGKWKICPN